MESFYDQEMMDASKFEDDQQIDKSLAVKQNLMQQNEEFSQINYSDQIHIFLRMKPLTKEEEFNNSNKNCFLIHSNTGISVNPPKTSVYAKNQAQLKQLVRKLYKFSYVFQPDISQQEFFQATLYPCFEKIFEKSNLLVFSYGITNSGKTYTMQGNTKNPGIIPRSIDLIFNVLKDNLDFKRGYLYKPYRFNEIAVLSDNELANDVNYKDSILNSAYIKKEFNDYDAEMSMNDGLGGNGGLYKTFCASTESLSAIGTNFDIRDGDERISFNIELNTKYAIWISFYELYNDSVYDLLVAFKKPEQRAALKIREDGNRIPYVEGLTYVPVFSTYEAIKVLKFGERNLQKSSNSINLNSSRSHAIFCLKIVSAKSSGVFVNQVTFCDLAGIERSSKTNAQGKTFKEASNINSSLLALSRCINVLMESQKSRSNNVQVPYRINKLTRLFQAYFEGGGMIKMITNINSSAHCFDETINVLNFASIANKIQLDENDILPAIKVEPQETTVGWDMNNETQTYETTQDGEEEDDEENGSEETFEEESDEETEEDDEEEEEEETEEEVDEDETVDQTTQNGTTIADDTQNKTNKSSKSTNQSKSIRTSIGGSLEELKKRSQEELIEIIKAIKLEKKEQKRQFLAYEYQIRDEITSKWSKIVNTEIKYYEEELKEQKIKLDKAHKEAIQKLELEAKQELDEIIAEIEQENRTKVEKYEEQIQQLRKENIQQNEKQFQSKSLQCEMVEKNDEIIDDLKEDLEMKEKQINELKETAKLLGDLKENLKNELSKSNAKIQELQNLVDDLRNEVSLLKESIEEIEAENDKLEASYREKQDRLDKLQESLKESSNIETKYKELKAVYLEIKSKHEGTEYEYNESIDRLKSENEMLKQRNSKVDELEETVARLEEDNYKLRQDLDTQIKIRANVEKDLHSKITSLRVELEDAKNDLHMAEVRCNSIAEENASVKAQLEIYKDEHQSQSIISSSNTSTTKTKATTKPSSKMTKVIKQSSKSSVHKSDDIAEEDMNDSVLPKPTGSQHFKEIQNVPVINDSCVIDEESTINATKVQKKGIKTRLTDMITKSPIFEPIVRAKRPSRVASTKSTTSTNKSSKTITSTASVEEDDEHKADASKSNKIKSIKTKTNAASNSLMDKFDKMVIDDENNENIDFEQHQNASNTGTPIKVKKTRSKKKV